nr:hypothetical protein [uncultured Roseateles sp.]
MVNTSHLPPVGQRAVALCTALSLAACASNPIVQWDASKTSLGLPASTLDAGYAYSERARTAYREAIVTQLGQSNLLANGLVVSGALVMALAAGKAHRDAVLGVAGLSGTAYALGNMNLSRPRLLVYQAGVEALNCANRAVAPFAMPQAELTALNHSLAVLDKQRTVTAQSRITVEGLVAQDTAGGAGKSDRAERGRAAVARVGLVQTAADQALVAGRGLASGASRASGELIMAVDRIDAAIVRGTLDTVPDLSAVPRVIAGLAGTFDQFAPGAGVGQRVTDGLGRYAGKATAGAPLAAVADPMDLAIQKLEADGSLLAGLTVDLNAALAGRSTVLAPDAFKDCGVADLAVALRAAPETLSFTLGEDAVRSLIISGGTKPYLVELDGSAVAGVSFKQPLPFESRAEVSVSKDLKSAQTLSLRVMDSSSPMRLMNVAVTVAAAASTPAAPVAVAAPKAPATADEAVAALGKIGAKAIDGLPAGMTMTKSPTKDAAGTVQVSLICPAALPAANQPTVAKAVQALLKLIGVDGAAPPFKLNASAVNAAGVSCLKP